MKYIESGAFEVAIDQSPLIATFAKFEKERLKLS